MIDLKTKVDGLPKFEKLIDGMIKNTGKDASKVVRNLARDLTRNLVKFTPLAKTKTKWKKILRKDGTAYWQYQSPMIDANYVGRGFAKAGWLVVLEALGVTAKADWHRKGKGEAKNKGTVVDRLTAREPFMMLTNSVDYINELDKGGQNNRPSNFSDKSILATKQKWVKILEGFSKDQKARKR
jgi:hypothetical protein